MKQYTIGVDVGGTNIKLGLVNGFGTIFARSYLETKRFHRNKTKLIEAIVREINTLISSKRLTSKDISGIGIGLPGLIDSRRGVVNFLPNVPPTPSQFSGATSIKSTLAGGLFMSLSNMLRRSPRPAPLTG